MQLFQGEKQINKVSKYEGFELCIGNVLVSANRVENTINAP